MLLLIPVPSLTPNKGPPRSAAQTVEIRRGIRFNVLSSGHCKIAHPWTEYNINLDAILLSHVERLLCITMDPTRHCVDKFENSVSIADYVPLNGPCQVRFVPIGSMS